MMKPPVVAIVPRSALRTLVGTIETRCMGRGVDVEWVDASACRDFERKFRRSQNVIAWNFRRPHEWLRENGAGRNVLHIDHSLLSQRAGLYADTRGYFSESSLRAERGWENPPEVDVEGFARSEFGWEAFSGGTPGGPILVALQCRDDCNLRMEFPLAADDALPKDRVAATLAVLRDHLPRRQGREIIIRAHPRERARGPFHPGAPDVWRDDWTLCEGGSFHELLPKCSALVTVNSGCATEAALLGIPVAVLGTGIFTGAGVALDCSADPSRLAELAGFQQDAAACRRYCAAILARNFLSYSTRIGSGHRCLEFERWLSRI